jgi:transcription initiation factor TFIID subunit 7
MNDRAPIRDRTLILRILVPGLAARLREKMKEMEELAAKNSSNNNSSSNKSSETISSSSNSSNSNLNYMDLEGVICEPTGARNNTLWNFHCDGATYPAKLVNLPCPVELHKTHDHAAYYKAADVAQMVVVYEDDMALEEAELGGSSSSSGAASNPVLEGFPSYYPSGLTPPMKRVVERRLVAREHSAVPPPRVAVAHVEAELVEVMEKIASTDKTKRSKATTLTSATKVLEDVEEEILDYEPWMSDYDRQPHGIEFDADDQQCSQHPEVWLSPSEIRELKEQDDAAKKKKQETTQAIIRKEKRVSHKQQNQSSTSFTKKKGISSKKNEEIVDEVTQAAASMLTSDGSDLLGAALDDDELFVLDLEDEDMNFDDDKL